VPFSLGIEKIMNWPVVMYKLNYYSLINKYLVLGISLARKGTMLLREQCFYKFVNIIENDFVIIPFYNQSIRINGWHHVPHVHCH